MSDFDHHLAEARDALSAEDLHGTLAWIAVHLHDLDRLERSQASAVLALYAPVLSAWCGEDPAMAARAAAQAADDPDVLYRLGVALVTSRELDPACGVLQRALERAQDSPRKAQVLHELCAADELAGRYPRSARRLEAAPPELRALPLSRYLHAFARLVMRDTAPARAATPELVASDSPTLAFMGQRLRTMLARHDALSPSPDAAPTDRLWHAVITGELTLDPRSSARETLASVHARLFSMTAALDALGLTPEVVTAPDDRDSIILGHAAAAHLGVPFAPQPPAAAPALVAVWDVTALSEAQRAALKTSTPGHALYVHAGRIEDETSFAADLIGVGAPGALTGRGPLRAPWGHDAEVLALAHEPSPARDARPLATIARDVLAAPAPSSPDDALELRACATALSQLPDWARPACLRPTPVTRDRRWRRTADAP